VPDYTETKPTSRKAWRAWLQKHHASASGVWLIFAKKHTGLPGPSYVDAVEEALCFGWIDGLMNPIDGDFYKQMFTPRKRKSTWAATNKARVERLIAAGQMTPAGLAVIAAAKANGSWTSIDDVEAMKAPPEFVAALKANPLAKKHYDGFPAFLRKQFLYRINSAKRPETRAARIAMLIDAAAAGRNPFRPDRVRSTPARTTNGAATAPGGAATVTRRTKTARKNPRQ
jgi:uncharacterized protein YdeI (YjbR/CyaY-like superfamily)